MKKSVTPFSIVLWAFAVLLAVYTVWAGTEAAVYLRSLFAEGAVLGLDFTLFDITQFYFNQTGAPLVFTLLLAAAGLFAMAPAVPSAAPPFSIDCGVDEEEEIDEDPEESPAPEASGDTE